MAVIGIDLGTTYSAAARYLDGNTEIIMLNGNTTLPSVVSVLANGKVTVGWPAKHNQIRNPQDTVVEVKRLMGQSVKVPLGQKQFSPQEISAMLLQQMKELAEEQLGEPIHGVVISCPAYFKDPERHATQEAGKIAGLNVLRIVNEPTAAAYAYGLGSPEDTGKRLALVYDLGGGTFDVTVIEMIGGNVSVIGTGGDPQLGGGNFDDCIVEWMLDVLKRDKPEYYGSLNDDKMRVLKTRLKSHAEDVKKKLCGPPSLDEYRLVIPQLDRFEGKPVVFDAILTMAAFELMIGDLLNNSMKWIDEAMKVPNDKHKYTEADITDILLVGGSTRVPLVRRLLEDRFGSERLRGLECGIDPDEIVARGASIVAAQIDPEGEEVVETRLIDVTGHTLSVAVFDEVKQREYLQPLIPKETPIPTSSSHMFTSRGDFQSQVLVKVYQGEGTEIEGNPNVTKIGEFLVEIEQIKDPIPLEIGLNLDTNGLLIAHATNRITGAQVTCKIDYRDSAQMSPEELKKREEALRESLEQGVGRSANPLEQMGGDGHAPAGWAQPSRPAQPVQTNPSAGSGGMNPIAASMVQRAIASFAKIPSDRQMQVMQLVGDINTASSSGNDAAVMTLTTELASMLDGVE